MMRRDAKGRRTSLIAALLWARITAEQRAGVIEAVDACVNDELDDAERELFTRALDCAKRGVPEELAALFENER